MPVSFRCSQCGENVSAAVEPGTTIECPHCKHKIKVPAVELTPAAATNANAAAQPALPSTNVEDMLDLLTKAMPFVLSLMLHLGLLLIMIFIVMYSSEDVIPENVLFPDAAWSEDPGGRMRPAETTVNESKAATTVQQRKHRTESRVSGKRNRKPTLIASGGGGMEGGSLLPVGLSGGGGPKSSFLGTGGNAHHVVYVIDYSGSMATNWELLQRQMLLSISKMKNSQDFHVILFAWSDPVEYGPKRLVPVTREHRKGVAVFLSKVVAEKDTRPIPAIERAFEVLKDADPRKPGKLIYLLTDADFSHNDEKVIAAIRRANADKSVMINTFLFREKPPDESMEKTMKQIAEENGGRYRYVNPYD